VLVFCLRGSWIVGTGHVWFDEEEEEELPWWRSRGSSVMMEEGG
jgi:hypothetical protein